MKILLSPAKTLDYETQLPTTRDTQPIFAEEAVQINAKLERQTKAEISELMSISESLTELNYQRYKDFEDQFTKKNSRPAIYAFAGDVYSGFDAYTLDTNLLDYAQDSVRILSGMYGVLRPLDLLQPYRLEMGTKLPIERNDDLYAFWKDKITPELNNQMKDDELLVNLASNEYFKAIDKKNQKGKLIAPIFKDYKNGKLKVISFYAKKARGVMARYLLENQSESMEDILAFTGDDYKYSEKDTQKESEPVFTR